jgi:hypothetical protein
MYALLTAHTSGTRSRRRFYSIAAPSGMLRTSWATTGSSPPNFYLGADKRAAKKAHGDFLDYERGE